MNSVRIDVDDNTHLIKSWKGEKIITDEGEKTIIASSMGTELLNTDMELKDRLEILLFRCFNFTSKRCNYDELSGKYYAGGDLNMAMLRGTEAISQHHCAGNICYHESSEEYLKFLEIMFWDKHKIIFDHNLKNRDIKILRSSGEIETGFVEDVSMCWGDSYDDFVLKVSLENKTLEKGIVLGKLLDLNPDIELEIRLPTFNDLPDWVEKIFLNWTTFIKNNVRSGTVI